MSIKNFNPMDSDEEDYYQYDGSDCEEEEADAANDNNETDFSAATDCRNSIKKFNSDPYMDSDEEDYHQYVGSDSEEEEAEADGNDSNEPDFSASTEYFSATDGRRENYKVLTEEDIKNLQENDISTVSGVLSVPRGVACTLLCRNNWNLNAAYDQWFAAAAEPAQRELGQQTACNICYDDITSENAASAACGHPFCTDCWKAYLNTAINDGPGCLTLQCPEPGCKASVGADMVESLASAAGKDKYYEFLRRSYVEFSRRRKWCPAPGCVFAVEFDSDGGGYDVTCRCSFKFCWKCTAERHRPVRCETVARWTEKSDSEEVNKKWKKVYTKPCPKCLRPIEKNQGCNYMTCRSPCNSSFCWVCGKSFDSHTSCNTFETITMETREREKEEEYLKRYTHYFERWYLNEKSRVVAMADLRRWREEKISKLAKVQGEVEWELQFVMEAWEQIVECRSVLKWSYAYGYYMEGESLEKKRFFEYLQGQAETVLEKLHHCAEKEVEEYLLGFCYKKKFKSFRSKLCSLTRVTKNYFENLVKALEDNLDEVKTCIGYGGVSLEKNGTVMLKSTVGKPRERANTYLS